MPTKFTVSLPDDVTLQLTEAAVTERRTPKAQAEWELIRVFSERAVRVERQGEGQPVDKSDPRRPAPEGEAAP